MKYTLIALTVLIGIPACAAGDVPSENARVIDDSVPEDPAASRDPKLARTASEKIEIPPAPRAEAELPIAPARIDVPEQNGEAIGKSAQALSTVDKQGDYFGSRLTLYVADGSGGNWLGVYPVTASIYNRFTGSKYWISGPGNFNEEGREILQNMGSRMYWDCRAGKNEAVISGYSRGAYNVLEARRWAASWGCAPTIRAALFVDPVDTLIWNYEHVVPDNAPTRILRKNFWTNVWAFVFANGAIYGGRQSVLETATTHPGFGHELWVADDEVNFANATLGWGTFR